MRSQSSNAGGGTATATLFDEVDPPVVESQEEAVIAGQEPDNQLAPVVPRPRGKGTSPKRPTIHTRVRKNPTKPNVRTCIKFGVLRVDPADGSWKQEIKDCIYEQVFVIAGEDQKVEETARIARDVLTFVRRRHPDLIDPVVVGPLSGRDQHALEETAEGRSLRSTGLDFERYSRSMQAGKVPKAPVAHSR